METGVLPGDIASALHQLDEELAEGDITTKGYLKRRTQLFASTGLSTYLDFTGATEGGSEQVARPRSPSLHEYRDHEFQGYHSTESVPDPSERNAQRTSSVIDDEVSSASHDEPSHLSLSYEQFLSRSQDSASSLQRRRSSRSSKRRYGSINREDSEQAAMDSQGLYTIDDRIPKSDSPRTTSPRKATGAPVIPSEDFNQARTTEYSDRSLLNRTPSQARTSYQLGNELQPLEPRGLPFAIQDPHNSNIGMAKFDNIAAVLRHRGRSNPKKAAFMVLDIKGKELATITWDKLSSRAEKVAQVIRDKSGLYRGDRVALVYRDCEVIDFAIALLGCFVAGVVAVPVNKQDDFSEMTSILAATQAHLALTTDTNLKAFHRELSLQKLPWPRGVEWWKTNEFGSFHAKKKDEAPPLQAPDLAYVEYSRSPTGELRGVVISHRTIMYQMACLSAIISTTPEPGRESGSKTMPSRSKGEVLVTYLDPRQAIGMILGVLSSIYHGNTTVWLPPQAVSTPGLFAHIITRYKASLVLADYPGLKTVAYNYQNDPMSTRGKKHSVDFSSIKLCLVDCLTVDTEFHEIVADRWLRPLGNPNARQVLVPMLCLPEHGGMVISMKDWLAGEERIAPLGVQLENGASDISEVLVDQEALKSNIVLVVAAGEDVARRSGEPGTVRVGSFWYPIADATLAVVDPETSALSPSSTVGEIWIDSPSMSACYWLLPRHTDTIFHARPYSFDGAADAVQLVDQEFLRTGLLGFVIHGRVFVLGLYEDRLRQKVEWVEDQQDFIEYRYHYVSHLVGTICRHVPRVFDCSAFDVYINKEHLPVVLLESPAASTTPMTPSGPALILDNSTLELLAEKVIESLLEHHQVRVYCVLICAPNALPRVSRNGRKEIGNMLCRKEFERGSLPSVYVKFAVERAVLNLPVGEDPVGGIWSRSASENREQILHQEDKQFSGIDYRSVVLDDRTATRLSDFSNIVDIFQWRAGRQTEDLALCTIDSRAKEGKGLTWKKLDLKIAAVAAYLRGKLKLRAGQNVILMYTHSEDFFFVVHACLCLGISAIPMAPLDPSRLAEDVPALLSVVQDYGVKQILTNNETHSAFSSKVISQHLKQSATAAKINLPQIYSTTKLPKQTKGCKDLGFNVELAFLQTDYPALIWTYWSPDQRRTTVSMDHKTILGCCKILKETCQMPSSRPVLGCVRSMSGLGFIQSCLIGMYVGCATYYLSPIDFANNAMLFIQILARYKIKDCYATPQTMDHLIASLQVKGTSLHELKNLMLSFDGRPGVEYYSRMRHHFATSGLDSSALNSTYGNVISPLIATRSYMCTEPTELFLDSRALREGFVQLTNPHEEPFGLVIQDSGMVPVSTRIAIVNPESCQLCRAGEFGEIWVSSEACANAFYGSKDAFDIDRFQGRIANDESTNKYVRSGDLGFLYTVSRPARSSQGLTDMQTLFVLGNIGETFEVHGLNHFPCDIEQTVERCHRVVARGGSAVFQAGEQVILLVEVLRTAHLSSIVPVIVNAVLNEHQVVIDRIAFCARGDFPRSRLREKQRGKILASWITRRLKTCVVFDIKDGESAQMDMPDVTHKTLQSVPETIPEVSPGAYAI